MNYDLVFISGIPGAGKTSTSLALAASLPRSVHISGDQLRLTVKGGFANPNHKWTDETKRQYFLSFKNEASLARNFIAAGFRVIVDDTIHGGNLYENWQTHFTEMNPLKVILMPSFEEAMKRNNIRESHTVAEKVMSEVYTNFTQHDYTSWFVVDNTEMTVEETVGVIRKKLNWGL